MLRDGRTNSDAASRGASDENDSNDVIADRAIQEYRISDKVAKRQAHASSARGRVRWEGVIAKQHRRRLCARRPLARLAQAQAAAPRRVRRRRLHRAATIATSTSARCLLGYFDRDGQSVLRRATWAAASTAKSLADMHERLEPLERQTSPFVEDVRDERAGALGDADSRRRSEVR